MPVRPRPWAPKRSEQSLLRFCFYKNRRTPRYSAFFPKSTAFRDTLFLGLKPSIFSHSIFGFQHLPANVLCQKCTSPNGLHRPQMAYVPKWPITLKQHLHFPYILNKTTFFYLSHKQKIALTLTSERFSLIWSIIYLIK